MKKFIPTSTHGYIDYATGAFLSTSPFYIKGLKKENKKAIGTDSVEGMVEINTKKIGAEQIVPYSMGVVSTIYSLFTNYELGVIKKIPMKTHLALDAIGGIFLAASPWIFGFYKKTWIPFVAVGAMEALVALFTNTKEEEVLDVVLVPQ